MNLVHSRHRIVPITAAVLLLALVHAVVAAPAAPVRIAYVNWSSSVASGNLVCAVVAEVLGRRCELIETTAEGMRRAVAHGEADALLFA